MFILSFAHRIQPPKEALQKSSKKYQAFPLSNPKPNHGRRGNPAPWLPSAVPTAGAFSDFLFGSYMPVLVSLESQDEKLKLHIFLGGMFLMEDVTF